MDLEGFFTPRAIAIVGASSDPQRIGGIPIRFLRESHYAGRVIPVNAQRDEVQGLPAVRSIEAIDSPVDLAIIALPAAQVPKAVHACATRQVRCVTVFSAGFAETDAAGAALQRELTDSAMQLGIRIVGPNCAGTANFHNGALASFAPLLAEGQPRAGNVALITQSGAFANFGFSAGRRRGVLFSKLLSTGNEADVSVADGIAYAADDPETHVVLCYLEGCRDGASLVAALAKASASGKPVVVVKVGRTPAGRAAAASHTAALAGEDAVFDGIFRQFGVVRVHSIEELFDLGYCFSKGRLPRNRSVGIVSVSGGVGVLMADEAELRGLDVAPMPVPGAAQIRALVPFAAPANPIDITAQVINDLSLFEQALQIVLREGDYASVVSFLGFMGKSAPFVERLLPLWRRLQERHPDRLLPLVSLFDDPQRQQLAQHPDLLVFEEPTHALRGIGALAAFAGFQARRSSGHAAPGATAAAHAGTTAGFAAIAAALPGGTLNEADSLALLTRLGVPVVAHRVATDVDAAAQAARHVGYPVVLKVVSRDVPHKAAAGGVALRLHDEAALRAAYVRMRASLAASVPQAAVEGFLVAPMVEGGFEAIAGVFRDPAFGPVVMCGHGGTDVERRRRVAFRAAPIDEAQALEMLSQLELAPQLAESGRDALARAVARLSQFAVACGTQLGSIDVNPLLVQADGILALDALVSDFGPAS